jgi:hydrogenase expression/formation protein HypC
VTGNKDKAVNLRIKSPVTGFRSPVTRHPTPVTRHRFKEFLMCLAVPMQVMTIEEGTAICEVDGVKREASLMMVEDVAVGDFVLIHAGFAIEKLDEEEALETLRLFRQLLDKGMMPE